MQIKELFYQMGFVSAAKVDKTDVCIFKRKFFGTTVLFLEEGTVILRSSLGDQNILQYENQEGFIGVMLF